MRPFNPFLSLFIHLVVYVLNLSPAPPDNRFHPPRLSAALSFVPNPTFSILSHCTVHSPHKQLLALNLCIFARSQSFGPKEVAF